MLRKLKETKIVLFFSLFSSFGTLACCAIPSTLVLMGFGASLAGFLSKYPEFIWLSENKGIVFGVSFFSLFISFLSQKYSAKKICPIDKKDACSNTREWSSKVFIFSFVINMVGFTYAFILPRFL